jgi:hypothetical protein
VIAKPRDSARPICGHLPLFVLTGLLVYGMAGPANDPTPPSKGDAILQTGGKDKDGHRNQAHGKYIFKSHLFPDGCFHFWLDAHKTSLSATCPPSRSPQPGEGGSR